MRRIYNTGAVHNYAILMISLRPKAQSSVFINE